MNFLDNLKTLAGLCLLVAFAVLAFHMPAFAAAAASASVEVAPAETTYTMNFTDTVIGLLGAAALGLMAAGMAVYRWTAKKWGWVSAVLPEEKFQAMLDKWVHEGIDYATSKLQAEDWLKVETKNEAIATAVNYVLSNGGDTLAKFGYSRAQLEAKLEAKLMEKGYLPQPVKPEGQ